jgi:hypothetical protein
METFIIIGKSTEQRKYVATHSRSSALNDESIAQKYEHLVSEGLRVSHDHCDDVNGAWSVIKTSILNAAQNTLSESGHSNKKLWFKKN